MGACHTGSRTQAGPFTCRPQQPCCSLQLYSSLPCYQPAKSHSHSIPLRMAGRPDCPVQLMLYIHSLLYISSYTYINLHVYLAIYVSSYVYSLLVGVRMREECRPVCHPHPLTQLPMLAGPAADPPCAVGLCAITSICAQSSLVHPHSQAPNRWVPPPPCLPAGACWLSGGCVVQAHACKLPPSRAGHRRCTAACSSTPPCPAKGLSRAVSGTM